MPSPFPGMNPYLEQESLWHDFHCHFLPIISELLNAQILPHYYSKLCGHEYSHEVDEESRGSADARYPQTDRESLSFLEIRDRDNRQLITVVELVSPATKYPGPNRRQYIAEARRLLQGNVHFVEIDLLRRGRPIWDETPTCDYRVMVSRGEPQPRGRVQVSAIRLRERLPVIPVPLLPGEADARLDLQEVLTRVYDAAGYHYYVYTEEPIPRLSAEDAAWARQFVPPH